MKQKLFRVLNFSGKLMVIYVVGFLIALVLFALISKYMKEKQYEKVINSDVIGFDFSKYTFVNEDTMLVHISDFKGKYVLVEFWFSGCRSCLSEMYSLAELAEESKDELVVLSISVEGWSQMSHFVNKRRNEGDNRFIKRANWKFVNIIRNEEMLKKLNIAIYPTYFILDKQGIVAQRPNLMAELEVKKLLSKGASLLDYIEGYKSVMPCGGLKKYLIAYSMALFLPIFLLYTFIVGIVYIFRHFKKKRKLGTNLPNASSN